MHDVNIDFFRFILVSIGAVLGVWTRFVLVEIISKNVNKSAWGTLLVNILASFSLGLFISVEHLTYQNNTLKSLDFFLVIGFLGSMSTFSSFIIDIMSGLIDSHYKDSFFLLAFSLLGGLLAIMIGYEIGNV